MLSWRKWEQSSAFRCNCSVEHGLSIMFGYKTVGADNIRPPIAGCHERRKNQQTHHAARGGRILSAPTSENRTNRKKPERLNRYEARRLAAKTSQLSTLRSQLFTLCLTHYTRAGSASASSRRRGTWRSGRAWPANAAGLLRGWRRRSTRRYRRGGGE